MEEQSRQLIRGAIYARVSSEHQVQDNTIASQLSALRERLEADGLILEESLCFVDDGYSGSTLLRPALERLRDAAWAGGFDRLYVHSPDRLARKYAWQVLLLEELERCSVEAVFLNHTPGASPEENLLLQMQGMIAEYERAKILERSRRGKRHAARRGSVNALCGAPYGYRYVTKHAGGGQAAYQILFEQARVVRQMFQWVGRDGLSLREVCRRLQAAGISSPTGKTWWDPASVWGILKNPAYRGSAAYGKTRIGERRAQLRPQRNKPAHPRRLGSTYDTPPEEQITIPVPAIIDEDLFAAVADQLAENRRRQRERKRGARYLLQGLLECGCCGYAYYGKRVSRSSAKGKTPYAYYRCIGTDAYRFGGTRVCGNKQVRTDQLDRAVWDDVCGVLKEPQTVRQEFERRLEQGVENACDVEPLNQQIGNVQRSISRLIDAYQDGLLRKEEFEPRLGQARERLERLQQEAAAVAQAATQRAELRLVIGQLDEFADRVRAGLDHADWETRREIIRSLVKSVKIEDGCIRITYRITPRPFADGPSRGQNLPHCGGSHRRALGRSHRGLRPFAVFADPGTQPFADQPQHPAIADPMLQKLDQPLVIDRIKEASVESLSSIDSADASVASLFADVAGTTDSCDFLGAFMSAVPPVVLSGRSAGR
jgi:site-specific DNA recombinase